MGNRFLYLLCIAFALLLATAHSKECEEIVDDILDAIEGDNDIEVDARLSECIKPCRQKCHGVKPFMKRRICIRRCRVECRGGSVYSSPEHLENIVAAVVDQLMDEDDDDVRAPFSCFKPCREKCQGLPFFKRRICIRDCRYECRHS